MARSSATLMVLKNQRQVKAAVTLEPARLLPSGHCVPITRGIEFGFDAIMEWDCIPSNRAGIASEQDWAMMDEIRPDFNSAGTPRWLSRWYWRLPLKWLVFLVSMFVVLFPNPRQFARHVAHLSDLEAMVDPDAPQFAEWESELRAQIDRDTSADSVGLSREIGRLSPRVVQSHVQELVLGRVQYGWDWDVWGSADYMPTVQEMFDKARSGDGVLREDCDGRAVMAASLMRRLGYESQIVTDLRHVWVVTPSGEWMGPGGKKTLVSGGRGNRLDLRTAGRNIPVSLSFGIAVFPVWREIVIMAVGFLLSCHRRVAWKTALLAGILCISGLFFMRMGVLDPRTVSMPNVEWAPIVGIVQVGTGFAIVWIASVRARRQAVKTT